MLFVALCASIALGQPAHAQGAQPDVQSIPVTSKQFNMKLSPDGNLLAVFEDSVIQADQPIPDFLPIHLFDLKTGKEANALSGFTDYASDVAFTPDSSRLASYHANGLIYLWDARSGKQLKSIPALPLPHRIAFLPDGKTLVVWQGGTNSILLWDTDSGYIINVLAPRLASQKDYKTKYLGSPPDWFAFADISADGKTLVTMSILGEISFWDVASGQETPVGELIKPDVKNMLQKSTPAFSPDGKLLLYADNATKAIHAIDVATRKEIASVAVKSAPIRKFFDVAKDGDTLAWAENDKGNVTLRLWSISKNASLRDIPVSTKFQNGLLQLAFTPDGRRLVLGGFAAMDNNNAIYVVSVPQ